ncbi:hypothetical protein [Nocardia harenae]|uniref:hypothetical protein n=1 Tax=Nocardia harenae TaxID=358707 RepID=UPI00082F1CA2|nr:hypothetical protein [Nocardia harenae]
MSAPAVETTMPAQAAPAAARMSSTRSTAPLAVLRSACTVSLAKTARPAVITTAAAVPEPGELAERLTAANQRAAELEERLAAVVAERDAAEHRAAGLEARNRELASDLDNALDQLAAHALHAEQERLVRRPRYSAFAASNDRGGYDR